MDGWLMIDCREPLEALIFKIQPNHSTIRPLSPLNLFHLIKLYYTISHIQSLTNRIETCNFSGFKIYPGHGSLYVRSDSRVYRFLNMKNKSLFLQRKKPSKFDWTIVYRRLHKKGNDVESTKKRSKKSTKIQRAVVGASLEAIKARREMNPAARLAERKKTVDKIKEEKKVKAAKKEAARPVQAKQKINKQAAKGGFAAKVANTSR